MESLSGIGSSLPPSVPDAELAHAFRGAALSLTALFKAGKNSTRKAYVAGKREALQDVLEFIQASLDHPPPAPFAGQPAVGPLNVARLIDYLCARQETLKADEEGDEDEGETLRPSRAGPAPTARPTTFAPTSGHSRAPQRPTTHSSTPAPAPAHGSGSAGHRSHDDSHPASASTSPLASAPSSFHPHPPGHRLAHSLPYSSSSSSANSHASTSSYPFAPTPLSSPLATSASPVSTIALASATGVPSPLTRLQARREREHKDKDHRRGGRTGAGSAANAATAAADSLAAGALKRRWGAVAMTEVELDDVDHESDSTGCPGRGDEEREDISGAGGGPREDAMELEVMEMDGWDGLGERPSKRVARRV